MFFDSESEVGKLSWKTSARGSFRLPYIFLLLAAASNIFCSLTTKSLKALQLHTKFTKTCNSDVISAADALFLSVFYFVFMGEKTLRGMHYYQA